MHELLSHFGLTPCKPRTAIIGEQSGRLTILAFGKEGRRIVHAVCRCLCGNISAPTLSSFRLGRSTSCGCYADERATDRLMAVTRTHSLARHRLYNTWYGMLQRCENPEHDYFADYGGRGITICERWRDVSNFIADMEPTYRPGLQLERSDNDAGYSPHNCHWATPLDQGNNKRNNLRLTLRGETKTAADWSRALGISRDKIYKRHKRGLAVELILR